MHWPPPVARRGCWPCRWTCSIPTTAWCVPWCHAATRTARWPRMPTGCSRWSRCTGWRRCARSCRWRWPPASLRRGGCRNACAWPGWVWLAYASATSIPPKTWPRCASCRRARAHLPTHRKGAAMTDAFPSRITVKHALELLRAAAAERGRATEQVATRRADGRVLAADVVAPIPLPAFDNSAMDGFAVRHADLSAAAPVTLELAGEQFAGPDLGLAVGPGQCVRITTGAPLPSGADTIVIREDAIEQDGRVQVPAGIRAGAHVRRQGEDVATGDVVLRAGQVLTPARIGLAAALGIDRLEVAARPTVAVFASGDELAEPGMPLRPGQVYNSNREQLMAQLRDAGLEPV